MWMVFLIACLGSEPGDSQPAANAPIRRPEDQAQASQPEVRPASHVRAEIGAESKDLPAESPSRRPLTPPRSPLRRTSPGASAETGADPLPASSRKYAWWGSTVAGLAIVLVFIAIAGRLLKSMAPGLAMHGPAGPIHVLYRVPFAPKQSLALIKCGSKLLLVGGTAERIIPLGEITDPEEIDLLKGQCMQLRPKSTTAAFRDLFQRSHLEPATEKPPAETRKSESEFAQNLARVKARLRAEQSRT